MSDSAKLGKAQKLLPHKEFGCRFTQAADANARVPQPNLGRLSWFVNQLAQEHAIKSTPETIRKWLAGEALPRHKSMHALSVILGVDQAWLAIGKAVELDERQQKLRNAMADGAVNLVAGLIQIHGGSLAFPQAGDAKAREMHTDLSAIIEGIQYFFHVAVAHENNDGDFVFNIPVGAEQITTIGLIRTGSMSFDLLKLEGGDVARHGKHKGGFWEVAMDASYRTGEMHWLQIRTFKGGL